MKLADSNRAIRTTTIRHAVEKIAADPDVAEGDVWRKKDQGYTS